MADPGSGDGDQAGAIVREGPMNGPRDVTDITGENDDTDGETMSDPIRMSYAVANWRLTSSADSTVG